MSIERIRNFFAMEEFPIVGEWQLIAEREQYKIDLERRAVRHELYHNMYEIINIVYSDIGITIDRYDFRCNKTVHTFDWKLYEMMDEAQFFQLCTVDDTYGITYNDYIEMLKQYSRVMTLVREGRHRKTSHKSKF